MSTTLHHHIVARARQLLTRPGGWVQGALAMMVYDEIVDPTDPRAARYCAVGALTRASAELTGRTKGAETLARRIHRDVMRFKAARSPTQMEAINDDDNGLFAILTLFDIYLTAPSSLFPDQPSKRQPKPERPGYVH
jgi:hypothetical protein